ncbi:MAG: PHP domain-containing protein [Deltaproteobacteria bacterium]|nr:PHP domain-containing protein [Deltaproteobacteria bacterium]
MKAFRADLHIHSCLSPCADLDMSPKAIVEKSLEEGLDIVALCDHNSAENVGAAIRVATKRGITVIPGMEINTKEEVHILALFEGEAQALDMQRTVYSHLQGTNRPELFGDQVVANELDEVEGFNDRLLIGATGLTLQEVIGEIHNLGGLCIASHIDRPSYSLLSQLGFVPPDIKLNGVEISRPMQREEIDIGKAFTSFFIEAPNLKELGLALEGKDDRKVLG